VHEADNLTTIYEPTEDSFTSLCVDDVRTSQEAQASTACDRDGLLSLGILSLHEKLTVKQSNCSRLYVLVKS
jgi:hypothetical protein